MSDLLDPAAYEKRKNARYDAFYGKSWLLYHYLAFETARVGQLPRYVEEMAAGLSSRDAALKVFGDFDVLEGELDHYFRRRRLKSYLIPPRLLSPGPVAVRKLGPGEAAIMPVRIRSHRGVDEAQAREVAAEARAIAARFPGDPAVLSALAEAEYDAGNDNGAIAAADAALAADPAQVNAYVQKGFALFRLAANDKDPATAYARARGPFIALNKREHDHPLPLVYYYRSYMEQGQTPGPLAIQGLERAVQLAPFDGRLRMMLAMQQVKLGRHTAARANLAPIAYDPHGGSLAEYAKAVMARLDADPGWDGSGLAAPADNASDDGNAYAAKSLH